MEIYDSRLTMAPPLFQKFSKVITLYSVLVMLLYGRIGRPMYEELTILSLLTCLFMELVQWTHIPHIFRLVEEGLLA